MSHFVSWQDYQIFARSVRTRNRYLRTAEEDSFLETVRFTVKDRIVPLPAGWEFWRAQRGYCIGSIEIDVEDRTEKIPSAILISRVCPSELIWMPHRSPHLYRGALVKCLPGVGWADDLRNRTRPPPVAAPRWPANVEANCDRGVLARGAAGRSGGRSCHDEQWRQSSNSRESSARELGRTVLSGWKTLGRRRIWSDYHRLPNRPR
jgi:hypothetical protein